MTMPADRPKPTLMQRASEAMRYLVAGVTPQTWMGPGQPQQPVAPEDTKGRQFDYPVAVNLNYRPRGTEAIGFPKLRAMAKHCDLLRIVMERQKDLIEAYDWTIKPREEEKGKRPSESAHAAAIKEVTDFLRYPDKVYDWAQWIRMALEDVFVIDALSIYRRRDMAGRPFALELLNGATITPLIDGSGRRPLTGPCYEQILKGVPAVQYDLAELLYYPKNVATDRIYGQSPVEQIINYGEAAIERMKSQKAYFTEGNVPDGIFTSHADMTAEDIVKWQDYWDRTFSGNTSMRRHGRWVPAGSEWQEMKQPPLKDEFDEWLARIICFTFSTSPMPFIKQSGLGNQGADSQQEAAEEAGIATYMAFVKRLIDRIIHEDFGHPELEFAWAWDKEFDPKIAAEIQDIKLRNGSLKIDEARDSDGLEPYPDGLGDMPMYDGRPLEQVLAPPPEPGFGDGSAPGAEGVAPASGGKGAAPVGGKKDEEKPAKDNPFTKLAKAAGPPLPAYAQKVRAKTKKAVLAALRATGKSVAHQVKIKLLQLGKGVDDDLASLIAAGVDVTDLDAMIEVLQGSLGTIAQASGQSVMAQLGVNNVDQLVNQVADRSVAFAEARAAEMVGKKWVDGELVDNPSAQWAISDGTRLQIRDTIANGLADNIGADAIADSLMESYAFSEERADLITITEINRANSQGSLDGAKAARDAGVEAKKVWLLGQDPCDECSENADEGAIDLDDDFPSGDDAPPGHPNCYCSLSYEVADEDGNVTETEGDGE